jgi:hypothetical protein
MPEVKKDGTKKVIIGGAALLLVLIAVVVALFLRKSEPPASQTRPHQAAEAETAKQGVRVPVKDQPLIEFKSDDPSARDLMEERKAAYGMKEGVDMIARSDETVKIGGNMVSMQEIADKIQLERGKILEKDLAGDSGTEVQTFGIYVVQPGDNIWNIHFRFLEDYFANRGIRISPLADEPDRRGFSSGVGKLLKFSENIVYIYNIKEERLDVDLDLIQPMSKIVVYNMEQVYALLDSIDYGQVDEIQFDGENIWIPAK